MNEPPVRVAFGTLLRRFLVLVAISLWQGGFLFYAAVVVPIGTDVLGSASAQGTITRKVTHSLNLIGAASLTILALDMLASRGPSRMLTGRWMVWSAMLVLQYGLFFLHGVLEFLLGEGPTAMGLARLFYRIHGVYLWLSSLVWALTLVWMGLSLVAWRRDDQMWPNRSDQ